jgi:hypothetical protein
MRKYLNTHDPQSAQLEGERLEKDYDFLTSVKPFTTSYFAQDLTFMAPMESTTVNIGSNLTNSGCSVQLNSGLSRSITMTTTLAMIGLESGAQVITLSLQKLQATISSLKSTKIHRQLHMYIISTIPTMNGLLAIGFI